MEPVIKFYNAKHFVELLIRKGHTVHSFAVVVGIEEATIEQITNGKGNPSPQAAKKICDALEVKFDDIFRIGYSKSKPNKQPQSATN
ncbi:helix-turn-helix transcriptional regulator [Cohnella herbarum]|uniref:Helix-turn-helix transcriptional regulator n=1 Tax=Cohnella herbarum TaxID=2728023 RepID=A0A7Z2VR76_9BACL|nr:helix-turn-helix transcriptional regulator [Cohnella herbarum]QJD87587.1 helix-turn-helix transcriptional regulator [Cohnella herbarum]